MGIRVQKLTAPIHAVYYRNSQLALRIQCFLDFIQAKLAGYAICD